MDSTVQQQEQELSVRLLGPLRAFLGGRELALGPPLQRAVLAVLAVRRDQVVYSSELIDALWGDCLPGNPDGGVHTYIAGLRRIFEPERARRSPGRFLQSRDSGYRLRLPEAASDLAGFERLRDRGRTAWKQGDLDQAAASLTAALALFDGIALGGVPGPFAEEQRTWLAEQRLAVAGDRIDVLLAGGRHRETIGELRTLTREHPLRERSWAQLMLALYRDGRQSDALAAFDRARAVTARELGLDPGPLLTRLRQQIVAADPELSTGEREQPRDAARPSPAARTPDTNHTAPTPRSTLPRDADHFTGRDRELRALLTMADPAVLAVCAIDGMPGIGKTSLALHAARLAGDRYPDAHLYLDLHGHASGYEPLTPSAALERLLPMIGVPEARIPDDVHAQSALWRSRLAGRRVLLVLDDAVDAAQLRPLLPGSPGALVLITSRRRLSGLDGGDFLSLDVLPAADAVALFTAVAGPLRTAAEPEATAAVVRACGYLPLAVRIAAARLRHRPAWSVTHLLARLGDEELRLAELRAEDRSVASAFALSYRSLSADLRRMFRLLGLFPGFSMDAGAAAALAGLDAYRADPLLEELVDTHLLDEPGSARYRLHDLIALFAARNCREEESEAERHAALARLLDFYLYSTDAAEERLRPGRLDRAAPAAPGTPMRAFEDRAEALAWLDAEHTNLVPVVRTAVEHGFHRHAWQIARYLWGFFETRRHRTDWIAAYEAALPSARATGDRLAEARILVGLGAAKHDLRRYDEASDHYRDALALMREAGFRSGEAGVLTNLGNTYRRAGRLPESIACQQQSVQICRQIGDESGEAIALANLGELYCDAGRPADGVGCHQQALAIFRKAGDRRLEASVLNGLAQTHLSMGEHDHAQACCHEALDAHRECGDRYGETESLRLVGRLHLEAGRPHEARQAWHAALAIADDLGSPAASELRSALTELEHEQSLESPAAAPDSRA